MTTVTIPKKLAREGDLVIIPLKEYKDLLLGRNKIKVGRMTAADKKAIKEAREQFARGEYYTLNELEHELDRSRRRTR